MNANSSKNITEYDRLFNKIKELILCHSPSEVKAEVDRAILEQFKILGVETWHDCKIYCCGWLTSSAPLGQIKEY